MEKMDDKNVLFGLYYKISHSQQILLDMEPFINHSYNKQVKLYTFNYWFDFLSD